MKNSIPILLLFLILFSPAYAQLKPSDALYKTIMSKDSLLFSVGFNTCNVGEVERTLSDRFEFYHDKDGVADRNKFMADFKKVYAELRIPFRQKGLAEEQYRNLPNV